MAKNNRRTAATGIPSSSPYPMMIMKTTMMIAMMMMMTISYGSARCHAFTTTTRTTTIDATTPPRRHRSPSTSLSSSSSSKTAVRPVVVDYDYDYDDEIYDSLVGATYVLNRHDEDQRSYVSSNTVRMDGAMGGGIGGGMGTLAYEHVRSLSGNDREELRLAIRSLCVVAHREREISSQRTTTTTTTMGGAVGAGGGKVMLGFCSSNVPEALGGLKSWVTELSLPRGMLHGMDLGE